MAINPVCWFEIYVDDMERAKAFYETVLAISLTHLDSPKMPDGQPGPDMWAFAMDEGQGASGAICKMDGVAAGGNSTLVYFSCQDCAVEAARVADAGGTLVAPKMPIGEHGFIAIALDSEGNSFGLHSQV